MHLRTPIRALALSGLNQGAATWAGLLGPPYPPPHDVSSNSSTVSAAWHNFTSTIEASIAPQEDAQPKFPGLANFTVSVGMFSLNDPAAINLQYHYTSNDVKKSAAGVNTVNSDSVYRIASVSKAFTAYLLLVELGSDYWTRPVSEFVPDLAAPTNLSSASTGDPLQMVKWEKATLGSLAAHMAGITRNPAPYTNDLLQTLPQKDAVAAGLPPLDTSILSACETRQDFTCPAKEYVSNINERAPVFPPWQSPEYSNAGFALLGLAIEKITKRSLDSLFNDDIFKPLQMASTSYTVPHNSSHAVIPGGAANLSFSVDYGLASASGGIYSTINDLSKFGIAILNSTLLPPEQTREWLKPVTHTADVQFSVGRPWEILRVPQAADGRIIDLYTKAGDASQYSSYFILSPDHEVGFSILTAGLGPKVPFAAAFVADTLATTVVPALESQAAHEAAARFAGLYRSNQPSLNSSVSLAVGGLGVVLESWVSNGTNVLPLLQSTFGDVDIILVPSFSDRRRGEIAFRAIGGPGKARDSGPFSRQLFENAGWTTLDAVQYGGNSYDLFTFTVNQDGSALAVTPAATRAPLERIH
ncbi:MAG: hypothetical protein M1812_001096 [Candelaria pacifica]|nr:MAG: hypothetical protein M1812_001096 [Candelaria pacifica]